MVTGYLNPWAFIAFILVRIFNPGNIYYSISAGWHRTIPCWSWPLPWSWSSEASCESDSINHWIKTAKPNQSPTVGKILTTLKIQSLPDILTLLTFWPSRPIWPSRPLWPSRPFWPSWPFWPSKPSCQSRSTQWCCKPGGGCQGPVQWWRGGRSSRQKVIKSSIPQNTNLFLIICNFTKWEKELS